MRNRKKTSDYHIIKLRCYASPYHLKRWHELNDIKSHRKHVEAARKSNDFFWKLFEHVTGKPFKDYCQMYFTNSRDCALEELESDHDIIVVPGEGWKTYFVPKKYDESVNLFQWVKDNIGTIPMKIMKRGSICFEFHEPSTRVRDESKVDWSTLLKIDNEL